MTLQFRIVHLLFILFAASVAFKGVLWVRSGVPADAWRWQWSSSLHDPIDDSNVIYWYRAFGRADSSACLVVLVRTETKGSWVQIDFERDVDWYKADAGLLEIGGDSIEYPTGKLAIFAGDMTDLKRRIVIDRDDSKYFSSFESSLLRDFSDMDRLWEQTVGSP